MTKTGATFLTEQSFDIEKLTSVLKNTKIKNNHDKKIPPYRDLDKYYPLN